MVSSLAELESWFADRPVWMQDAAKRILHKGEIAKDDLEELIVLCKSEAGIYDTGPQSSKPSSPIRISLQEVASQSAVRLQSIFDLKGINALAPREPLEFNEAPITIVYGQNASGKSGYTRALKHASGQRKPGSLLGDVFSKSNNEQSCRFKFSIDGVPTKAHWIASAGPVAELRTLQVYDSNCASIYVNEENEVAYEPFILSLFTKLTDVCSRLNSALEIEINSNPSRRPSLPVELQGTQPGLWYGKLSHLTTTAGIAQRCQWPEELETELLDLKPTTGRSESEREGKRIKKA